MSHNEILFQKMNGILTFGKPLLRSVDLHQLSSSLKPQHSLRGKKSVFRLKINNNVRVIVIVIDIDWCEQFNLDYFIIIFGHISPSLVLKLRFKLQSILVKSESAEILVRNIIITVFLFVQLQEWCVHKPTLHTLTCKNTICTVDHFKCVGCIVTHWEKKL